MIRTMTDSEWRRMFALTAEQLAIIRQESECAEAYWERERAKNEALMEAFRNRFGIPTSTPATPATST